MDESAGGASGATASGDVVDAGGEFDTCRARRESRGSLTRSATESTAGLHVTLHAKDGRHQRRCILTRNEKTVAPVVEQIGRGAHRRGDNGQFSRHRLEEGTAESLGQCRKE